MALCAKVFSPDQKADFDRQLARLAEFSAQQVGLEYVEAALAAQGRRVVVVDGAERTDDIMRDLPTK